MKPNPVEIVSNMANRKDGKGDTKVYKLHQSTIEPDELYATMEHSDKFNIIVEGPTDHDIYDRLIVSLGIHKVDYYIAGGRDGVFGVYRLIKEAREKGKLKRVRVAFIADQDSWVFLDENKKPPADYGYISMDEIIWTEGYSIENDLYIAGRLRDLVSDEYNERYQETLEAICTWYAFQVESWEMGENLEVIDRIRAMISETGDLLEKLRDQLKKARFNASCSRFEEIKKDYEKLIPGKLLFQLILFFLKRSGFPTNYSPGWNNALAQIAITVCSKWGHSSPKLIENLEKEVKCKLPELEDLSDSTLDKLLRGKRV